MIAGDESAQRYREAKGRIERGLAATAEESGEAGSPPTETDPSDALSLHPEVIEGVRRLQSLHEEIWGRNHMVIDPDRRRHDAEVAVSLTEEIMATLFALPPEVRAFYIEEFGLSARTLLERALAARDLESLLRTAKLYPLVETAPRALLAAGDLCYERAEISRAAGIWETITGFVGGDATAGGAYAEEIAIRRALIASRRGTRSEREASVRELARFGRSIPELTESRPGGAGTVGGAGVQDAGTAFPTGGRATVGDLPRLPFDAGRLEWRTVSYQGDNLFSKPEELPFTAVPTDGPGWVAIATSRRIYRYSIDSGKQIGEVNLLPMTRYRERTSFPRFYTASEGDFLVTSFVADRSDSKTYLGYDITVEIPQRGLKGIRIDGEDVIWDTTRDEQDALLGELSFNGSILIDSGRVYALGWRKKGYIDVFLVCLDLHTGERLWSAPIVGNQVELTMFGEAAYEPIVGQVSIAGNSLYCSTNLGAIAKVRASDGHVLWATAYDPRRRRQRYGRRQAVSEQETQWERNPLIVHDGRLFATPLDSDELLVIDPVGGRVMQAVHGRRGRMLGIWNDFLVLVDRRSISLLPYRDLDRSRERQIPLAGNVRSRPALVEEGIVYATDREGIFFRSFRDDRGELVCSYGGFPAERRTRRAERPIPDGDVYVLPDRILTVSSQWIQCYTRETPPGGRSPR